MRRSTRRETGKTFDWLPFWWGNKFNKRRLSKIIRRKNGGANET